MTCPRDTCERCGACDVPDVALRERGPFLGWVCLDCAEELDEAESAEIERLECAREDSYEGDPAYWRERMDDAAGP